MVEKIVLLLLSERWCAVYRNASVREFGTRLKCLKGLGDGDGDGDLDSELNPFSYGGSVESYKPPGEYPRFVVVGRNIILTTVQVARRVWPGTEPITVYIA
jgi:hypothetical protein